MRDLLKGTKIKLVTKSEFQQDFAKWIKHQRLLRGWSQLELAELTKLQRSLIPIYEAGTCIPRSFTMYQLKELFKQTKHLIKYNQFTVPGQGDAPRGGVRGLRGERG